MSHDHTIVVAKADKKGGHGLMLAIPALLLGVPLMG